MHEDLVIYTCHICNGVFSYPLRGRVRCLVLHHPGQCCHYGETRVEGVN